jgi:hypothetical protein
MNPCRSATSIGLVFAVVMALATAPAHAALARRLAERGPATLIVGTTFVLASPPGLLLGALRGDSVRLDGCRFVHGLEMLVASPIAVPAGLLLAPFHLDQGPGSWMDGLVDALQEDYCSRPVGSLLP